MFSDFVKTTLSRHGYALVRTPPLPRGTPCATQGLQVELLAPSGAGKSTLYRSLRFSDDWMRVEQVERGREPFMALPDDDDDEVGELYAALLFARFQALAALPLPPGRRLHLVDFFTTKLRHDLAWRSRHYPRGVISHDGLCHNFVAELAALAARQPEYAGMAAFLAGRALIHLMSTPERIMAQLESRHRQRPGGGNDWLGHLGEGATLAHVKAELAHDQALCRLFALHGRPLLTLNADDDLATQQTRINAFLASLTP